jgi:hypothetical protein
MLKSCIVNAFHIVGILVRIFTFSERARTTGSLVPDRKRVGGVDRTVRSPDTGVNNLQKMEREVLEMWSTS